MDKHRVNIFIALVLVLIIIAAVSAWLTSDSIKDTVPDETADPSPVVTPSVISTPTPVPEQSPAVSPSAQPDNNGDEPAPSTSPVQPSGITRSINQSGSFESNTGTKMIMYVNWTAVSENSETVTLNFNIVLSTYTLSVGPHNGVITVNGVDYKFTSPGISYRSEKVRNEASLATVTATVTVPAGQAASIPVSASWDFFGTYGGVEISQVTAGGTISIQG